MLLPVRRASSLAREGSATPNVRAVSNLLALAGELSELPRSDRIDRGVREVQRRPPRHLALTVDHHVHAEACQCGIHVVGPPRPRFLNRPRLVPTARTPRLAHVPACRVD